MVSKSLRLRQMGSTIQTQEVAVVRPRHKPLCGRKGGLAEAQTLRYLGPHGGNLYRNFISDSDINNLRFQAQ